MGWRGRAEGNGRLRMRTGRGRFRRIHLIDQIAHHGTERFLAAAGFMKRLFRLLEPAPQFLHFTVRGIRR